MIDFHCHVDLYPNPQEIVENVQKLGVHVISVTTTPSAFEITKSICDQAKTIKTALGLHPQIAQERQDEISLFDFLLEKAEIIGEVGLDGSYELKGSWQKQIDLFRHILCSCSKIGGRIISIHSRKASNQVLSQLQLFPDCGIPVFHWFSGPKSDLKLAIDMKCWFSVGPTMLNSNNGIQICKEIPIERILTESDGPFVNINQRSAFPWDVQIVEKRLAMILNQPVGDINQQLIMNWQQLFNHFQKHEKSVTP